MHLPSYQILEIAGNYSEFKFVSVWPNGQIQKLVLFRLLDPEDNIYNVALLDILESGMTSDTTVSNNNDMREILATVTRIIIDYSALFPERKLFFRGSDEEGKRMAVYHRAIREYYSILQEIFFIEGFINEKVKEPFNPLNNYHAFLVKRK